MTSQSRYGVHANGNVVKGISHANGNSYVVLRNILVSVFFRGGVGRFIIEKIFGLRNHHR